MPADITAAFLTSKAGIAAANQDAAFRNSAIFWTFVAILLLSPIYFWFVSKVKNAPQIIFLCLSFVVFGISIAEADFSAYLGSIPALDSVGIKRLITIIAIVLPVLWAFMITQIFVEALGSKVESK